MRRVVGLLVRRLVCLLVGSLVSARVWGWEDWNTVSSWRMEVWKGRFVRGEIGGGD